MITAAKTKEKMQNDRQWWKVALFDFVDSFRLHRDPLMIREPYILDDERIDAVLASVIEDLCDEMNMPVPAWLADVPPCREPYFVSGIENLKASALAQSPTRFRLRKVFVLDNFLSRV